MKEVINCTEHSIAIIGMACRFPGARDLPSYWDLLKSGKNAISMGEPGSGVGRVGQLSVGPNPKPACRYGGYIDDVSLFDPMFFHISHVEAKMLDPQQRLMLETCWVALENAGIPPDTLKGTRTGVYAGINYSQYLELILDAAGIDSLDPASSLYTATGNVPNTASGRVSFTLGLKGPAVSIDTACSSSLVALHQAVGALKSGESDLALAGGVNMVLSGISTELRANAGTLSPDGRCATFDEAANGYVRGEGCGILVLKRLAEAEEDGDRIWGVIPATAINQDGASKGLTVPDRNSQELVIRDALKKANIQPTHIDYLEAHGTGTKVGDRIELEAIANVYGKGRTADRPLFIGSVKTNIGHLETAAGVAGVIKVLLAMNKGVIPKHLHFKNPSPVLAWKEIPIQVPTEEANWPDAPGRLPYAGVSGFGWSGTNAHIVLQGYDRQNSAAQYTGFDGTVVGLPKQIAVALPQSFAHDQAEYPDRKLRMLPLSGKSDMALLDTAKQYRAWLNEHARGSDTDPSFLANMAWTACTGRNHFPHRAGLVYDDLARLREQLDTLIESSKGSVPYQPAKIGFLFTGQGSQWIGMGQDLYETEPVVRAVLDRCEEIVQSERNTSLLDVIFGRSQEDLHNTAWAQPAIYAIECAIAELWASLGIWPEVVMGHSVGEFSAAHIAGIFSLKHGLLIAMRRSELLSSLPEAGAMAAIFAPISEVESAVHAQNEKIQRERLGISAANGAHQVISGPVNMVQQMARDFESQNIRVSFLKTDQALHSPLVEPRLDELEKIFEEIETSTPSIQFVSNVTGQVLEPDRILDGSYWRRHARQGVVFSSGVRAFANLGVDLVIEVGPHAVLGPMLSLAWPGLGEDPPPNTPLPRVLSSLRRPPKNDGASIDPFASGFLTSVASAYEAGMDFSFEGLFAGETRTRISLPGYPFQREHHWIETNKRRKRNVGHPLLGDRHESATGEVYYETELYPSDPAWLQDHKVFGRILAPGALYGVLADAASRAEYGAGIVRDLQFHAPMVFPKKRAGDGNDDDSGRKVQTVVRPSEKFDLVQILSKTEKGEEWTIHAECHVSTGSHTPQAPQHVNLDQFKNVLSPGDLTAFYRDKTNIGIGFGPSFHTVQAIWMGENEALGEIVVSGENTLSNVDIHPLLLDGCFQVISAAHHTDAEETRGTYLPFGCEQLWFSGQLPNHVFCHVQMNNLAKESSGAPAEVLSSDLHIYDTHGTLLGQLNGYIVKRVRREADLLSTIEDVDDLLYEVIWREHPLVSEIVPANLLPSPKAIAEGSGIISTYLADEGVQPEERTALLDDLEQWSHVRVLKTLEELEWQRKQGDILQPEILRKSLEIISDHQRLFRRMLEMLSKAGILEKIEDSFCVRIGPQDPLPDGMQIDLEVLADQIKEQYPHGAIEIGLLSRCGNALGEVLRGQADPLALLFDSGDPTPGDLYLKTPMARATNRILKETVSALVSAFPADRRLRIIEIGAGTGSATAVILPELPKGRFDYVYTDISAGFFAAAEERFGDKESGMDYRPLNIEKDPAAQGFALHSYDLLIASNVLHATRYLNETLAYCRDLLAPSGQIVAFENLIAPCWMDLVFGLLDGWWRFEDTYRSDHALASSSAWRCALSDAGFGEVEILGIDETDSTKRHDKGVIVAQGPTKVQERTGVWVLVADRNGVSQDLAEELAQHHQMVVLVDAGKADSGNHLPKLDEPGIIRVTTDIYQRESWEALLQSIPNDPPLQGIVHLLALDGGGPNASTEEMGQDVRRIIESALTLVQAMQDVIPAKGLWLITQGAQVLERETAGQLAGAALWGFGKSVARELPLLRTRMIDLDPGKMAPSPDLVAELLSPDPENHIAYRFGKRNVARLVRADTGTQRLHIPDKSDWVIAPDPDGTIKNLYTKTRPHRALEPHEVRIAVKSCGLNYWDVFRSLGFIQEHDLGREMCGNVLEVGSGVSTVSVGDYVIGLGISTLAAEVVTHEQMVARAPSGLSMSELATIPTAFVSAAMSFDLADLKANDRVLIHSGAGGVGMAAIQIAQIIGAEIFATASPPKQNYLHSIGVKHVFNSREPRFGAEILEATNGDGVDVVLNSLTGKDFIDASLSCLAEGGRFIELSKRNTLSVEKMATIRPDVGYAIYELDVLKKTDPAQVGKALRSLLKQFDSRRLKPLPHSRWPMSETGSALQFMQRARHLGKVVVTASPLTHGQLRADQAYLITGGMGGIGCAVANWLADRGAKIVVLNGRRPPDQQAQETIDTLRARGLTVHIAIADIANPDSVDRMLADLQHELPPLAGVIHSVGVLSDGVLGNQTWERFEQVLWPKVIGAWHLHHATAYCDLDFFVLFSSRVGVMGGSGNANHAAANAFLDQLAAHRRAIGLPGQTIAWGTWAEIGEAAEQKERIGERLAALGSRWFTPQEGIKALDKLIRTDGTHSAVMSLDWKIFREAVGDPPTLLEDLFQEAPEEEINPTLLLDDLLSRLRRTPESEHRNLLVSFLQQELQAVLHLPSAPSPTTGFFDLGMDSLMAVELRNRLNRTFADEYMASNTVVFDYPNINALAKHLADKLGTLDPAPLPKPIPRPQPSLRNEEDGIAVIGMACQFPGAPDIEAFWDLLESGKNTVSDGRKDSGLWKDIMGDPAAEEHILKQGSFLEGLDQFDAGFFEIRSIEARSMDPRQRILLETSWQALEDAAIDPDSLRASRTGIYVGMGASEYRDLIAESGKQYNYLGTSASAAIGRISFLLGLMGPAVAVDMTCASSLAAIHQATSGLRYGEVDLALAGGVQVALSPAITRFMAEYGMLSSNGNCRTFDASADGFVRGEGCGIVLLKRLRDAVSDGDRIWGVIRGSAVNQNGAGAALTVPNGKAQEQVMEDALTQSGIPPSEVDFLEVHATGSQLGDPIEVNSIATVYGRDRDADHTLLLGTVKTNIGHLESAAGIAGLIKVLLAMQRGVIPKHLHFENPNPYIDWTQLPVQVTSAKMDWPSRADHPPRAGISAFAISGANAHVVVEGYNISGDTGLHDPAGSPEFISVPYLKMGGTVPDLVDENQRHVRLLPLSAKSDEALRALSERYLHWLDEHASKPSTRDSDVLLSDMAWTAAVGRNHFAHRAGVVFEDESSLRNGLIRIAGTDERRSVPEKSSKLAFVLSAEDAPWAGMGEELYRSEPVVRAVLDQCDELLQPELGGSLLDVMLGHSENLPDSEIWRSPALFALQCAQVVLWESVGVCPDVVFGIGSGEIAAAYAAGALKLKDGLTLAVRHAELIHENSGDKKVNTFLAQMPFALPSTRMVSGVTGLQISSDMPLDATYWTRQARSPAVFDKCIATIADMEVTIVVEIGHEVLLKPKILSTWSKILNQTDAELQLPMVLASPGKPPKDAANEPKESFMHSVARLYEAGLNINFAGLFAKEKRSRISLPRYPFQRRHFWFENSDPNS